MTDLRDQLQSSLGAAYQLERELGGGGMSRVFVAQETRLGRRVVVKLLSPDLAAGISAERFEREIRLAASLQQANIVPLLSAGDTNGLPYYTMPLVEGESLRARLARGPLAITETVRILGDVARALGYAHQHGVVHRDIKPDNVLLSGGTAVVTDFGIAKALSASRSATASTTLTQLGTSIGTPAYMSPEQAAGDPDVDHRADIYAFGCMAYELLAGRSPFHDRTPHRVLAAHMSEAPQDIRDLRLDTPPALADLVMRSLAKDAEERPQSATELMQVLDAVTSGSTMPSMPLTLLGQTGMLKRALAVYGVSLVAVAILARAAIVAIGLPSWVFPGAIIVMALGLPVILFTAYSHHVTRRMATATPTLTPGGTARTAVPQGTLATIAVKASPHLSWRRTTLGGVYALVAFALLTAAFMVLRALGVGPFGSLLAAGELAHREPLLMTEFRVVSADSTLGGVIAQAVRSNLEQSSAITLVTQATVTQALQRMERPSTARLDLAMAREIAAREGVKAIVDGEIAGIGSGFLLTLRLVTADSARELASFRQAADGPTELIDAVDVLSRKLRGRIGESLREVQASPPLARVTTASIEALRKYTEATRATGRSDWMTAAQLAREAVAIDSGFALAWRHLSEALFNAGMPQSAYWEAISKAFELRHRLSERERLTVTAEYYSTGPGRDRGKAIEAYKAQLELGEYTNTNSLGLLLASRREFALADSLGRLRIRIDPGYSITYTNIAGWLLNQGKTSAAESTLAVAARLFPDRAMISFGRSRVLYASDDITGAKALLDSAVRVHSGQPRFFELRTLSAIVAREGRIRDAFRLYAEASRENTAGGVPPTPGIDSLEVIEHDVWRNGPSRSHVGRVDAVIASAGFSQAPVLERPYLHAAAVYAMAGAADRARALLARYDTEVADTAHKRIEQPLKHRALGEIALAENRPRDAVVEFARSDSLPDGPATGCSQCLFALLARAYDAMNDADSTIAMVDRYLSTPNANRMVTDAMYLAPFSKRLGELYEARGDRTKAAAYYQKFVDLWKDADAELQPRVQEVRRRLARLRDPEPPR